MDDGTNLEIAEAITRAITRRIADRRRGEQARTRDTVTEKELVWARLSLLHAQVENLTSSTTPWPARST